MENIILINELVTREANIIFGYVGRSLETGKIKYYFLPDKRDDNLNLLQEFDINNIDNEYLSACLNNCDFERPRFSSLLPKELEEQLSVMITEHEKFNEDNGCPTSFINKNKIDLSVQILRCGMFRVRPAAALYNSLENKIQLRTTQSEWKILSNKEKESVKSHLIHEVGHLKAARCFLVENILNVQTGFSIDQRYTSPIRLANGDILYKLEECVPKDITQMVVQKTLEETMNDYDCHNAFPSFHRNYPRFGEELDNLCDSKLSSVGRYIDGVDTYYDGLCSIIPNRDLATELLETIYAATYGTSREATEEKAKQIIKRYEHEKGI